jgi:hypothetical protein
MTIMTATQIARDEQRVFMTKFRAMAIGNVMEWFDFAVFGALADVIGSEFFPAHGGSELTLLKSFSVRRSAIRVYTSINYIYIIFFIHLSCLLHN